MDTTHVIAFGLGGIIGAAIGFVGSAFIGRMFIKLLIDDNKSLTAVNDAQGATIERLRDTVERLNNGAAAATIEADGRATATS